mgnify:CR=1 FL=1|tara:strand:- start:592 stop:1293 length:702 start_codon:yes stop_codon:yes gene_type:complete
MRVFAHIGARSGSKGLKNKNILRLKNIPLINWTLNQIVGNKDIFKVVVSSDSKKIIDISKKAGANIVIQRPKFLSNSKASKFSVWKHSLKILLKYYKMNIDDIFFDLDCTCPLRKKSDIKKILKRYKKSFKFNKIDGLISVTEARKNPYFNLLEESNKGFLKISKPLKKNIVCRQDAPKVYEHVASMYAISPKYILKNYNLFSGKIFGYNVDPLTALDIDSKNDLKIIKKLMK